MVNLISRTASVPSRYAEPLEFGHMLEDGRWRIVKFEDPRTDLRCREISTFDPEAISLVLPVLEDEAVSPRVRIIRMMESYPEKIRLDPWMLQVLWHNKEWIPENWTRQANLHKQPIRICFDGIHLHRPWDTDQRAVLALVCEPSIIHRRFRYETRRFSVEAVPLDQKLTPAHLYRSATLEIV